MQIVQCFKNLLEIWTSLHLIVLVREWIKPQVILQMYQSSNFFLNSKIAAAAQYVRDIQPIP